MDGLQKMITCTLDVTSHSSAYVGGREGGGGMEGGGRKGGGGREGGRSGGLWLVLQHKHYLDTVHFVLHTLLSYMTLRP